MTTVTLARRMYGDGDSWTPTQIARYLNAQGIEVHPNTVRYWVVPRFAERQRRANIESYRRRNNVSDTPALDRARELRSIGLSLTAVSLMLRHEGVADVTVEQLRYSLRTGRDLGGRSR
jgi:hypothetical protein